MEPLILFGAGGHCLSCIDVIETEGKYSVQGVILEDGGKPVGAIRYPVLGYDYDLIKLIQPGINVHIAVGQIRSPQVRIDLFNRLMTLKVRFPALKSPHSYVSKSAELGFGSIVMHRATVNSGAVVGMNTIINSHSLIEHGAALGSHCHLSTGAILNGDCQVGSRTFIGSGSVIKEGIHIGDDVIIGAGLVIKSDVPSMTYMR